MTVAAPSTPGISLTAMEGRLVAANQLVAIIAKHGRHFFFSTTVPRLASFLIDPQLRLCFQDDYTGKVIVLPPAGVSKELPGFSHGGTLRSLVEHLRDYILEGTLLDRALIAPPRPPQGSFDLWGYGDEAAEAVRAEAWTLPLFKPATS